MRILRERRGFQADHSSSSYLFYAADRPVSTKGRQVAHRFSSRADVDERTARYQKWGESELSWDAHKALLTEHYDVMASESYDWWTLMIAVPKMPQTQALLAPFRDARGGDDLGVDVEDYGPRLVVSFYCMFDYGGSIFQEGSEDSLEELVERLAQIRAEVLQGNVSFLQAVAEFYRGKEEDEEGEADEEDEMEATGETPSLADLSKAELQQECRARGLAFRKSWTKQQLLDALSARGPLRAAAPLGRGKPGKLSEAARAIVENLDRP